MGRKIVFLGSDGSGKSSLIKYIYSRLEKEGKVADVFFMGWKNFHNPILRAYSRGKKGEEGGEKLSRYRERSWFFYFVYYSEMWLRYIWILLSGRDYLLIDRYFYDELAFARGFKFSFFNFFTPKPDVCFVLKTSASTLKKRKVNVSKKNLDNFYNGLKKMKRYCKITEIDSSEKVEETFKRILDTKLL